MAFFNVGSLVLVVIKLGYLNKYLVKNKVTSFEGESGVGAQGLRPGIGNL
jgi:hypothetical protein